MDQNLGPRSYYTAMYGRQSKWTKTSAHAWLTFLVFVSSAERIIGTDLLFTLHAHFYIYVNLLVKIFNLLRKTGL